MENLKLKEDKNYSNQKVQDAAIAYNQVLSNTCELIADCVQLLFQVDKNLHKYVDISQKILNLKDSLKS